MWIYVGGSDDCELLPNGNFNLKFTRNCSYSYTEYSLKEINDSKFKDRDLINWGFSKVPSRNIYVDSDEKYTLHNTCQGVRKISDEHFMCTGVYV